MPIEIRELVIKATVDSSQGQGTGSSSTTNGSGSGTSSREDLINECVDKVLAIIKEKNER